MNRAYHPVDLLVEPRLGTVSDAERGAWMPILLLGSRAGYHGGMVIDSEVGAARRRQLVSALVTAARSLANDLDAASVALLYAPEKHAAEVLAESDPGRMVTSAAPLSAEAVIPLEGREMEPGKTTGSNRKRREQRRESRIFAAGGSVIVRARLSACYDTIGPLLGQLQRKYGEDDTDDGLIHYLNQQAAFLDHCSHVLLEKRKGEVVGFALCYEWENTLHVRAAGFGERSGPYAYFNLVFYEAVRVATERGLSAVDLGTGAYRAKLLRGAVLQPTWSIVWPPTGTSAAWRDAICSPGEDYLAATHIGHLTRRSHKGIEEEDTPESTGS